LAKNDYAPCETKAINLFDTNPGRSKVFWRLTLGLLLSYIFVTFSSAWIFSQIAGRSLPSSVGDRIEDLMLMAAHAGLSIKKNEGDQSFENMITRMNTNSGFRVYLYDANGIPLSKNTDNPRADALLASLRSQGEESLKFDSDDDYLLIRARWIIYDGQRYAMIVLFSPMMRSDFFSIMPNMWPALIASSVLFAIISAFVAHWLLGPIQILRTKTRAFTAGDWTSRVGPELGYRNDEFSDLGKDFDGMASHIGNLINSQQRLMQDISHELRSPLARIRIALALAEKNNQYEKSLAIIDRNADKLDELIGEILTLARLEHNQMQLDAEVCDLTQICQETTEFCQIEAQQKQQLINFQPCELLPIKGNPSLLQRAIENVLRNAISHTPEGTVITLSIKSDTNSIKIDISDNGPGVSDSEIGRLFEPFFRADHAHQVGSGLGLAIAKRAIELHNGTIHAKHNADSASGLRVCITLPNTQY
jgi:signal transduction histidine kinase